MTQNTRRNGSEWGIEAFDPACYLERIGVDAETPGLDLLERIHLAHVRTFPFSNVDVLLGRHPGVEPATVARRMLQEGTGGYCFEHAQLMAGVLEQLGLAVRRRLGRVHSLRGSRTHMSLDVALEGRLWMMDPGFGLSLTGPIAREDGARREEWFGTMTMRRRRGDLEHWELRRDQQSAHFTDLLDVEPVDVRAGHHVTSTMSGAGPFQSQLIVSRFLDSAHVTVTTDARTIRRPGQATEREELTPAQAVEAAAELGVPIDSATAKALVEKLSASG